MRGAHVRFARATSHGGLSSTNPLDGDVLGNGRNFPPATSVYQRETILKGDAIMGKSWTVCALALCLTIALSGCSSARKPSAGSTGGNVQAPAAERVSAVVLPGDQGALTNAIAAASAVKVQVITVDEPAGDRKDDVLDSKLRANNWPEKDMFVVVIFTKDNFDLRFAMGAVFNEKKIGVDEMLALARAAYFPKAKQNDPAGGLADFIRAVNDRVSRG